MDMPAVHASSAGPGEDVASHADFSCPVCREVMRSPCVTPCGHTFCHACILRHVQRDSTCPCCRSYLTEARVWPNHLLAGVCKALEVRGVRARLSPIARLKRLLEEVGPALLPEELDAALHLLWTQRQRDPAPHLLLHFLQKTRQSKEAELDRVQDRLDCLETDIRAVARRVDPARLPGTELEDTGSSREEGEDSSNASGSGVSPRDPAPGPDPTRDLAGAPLFVPGGKRARLSQHLDGLLAAYEARRGAGAGPPVPGGDGGGLGALAGALDLVHRAAALETVAVIPRPPGARPNSIVSGLEYNSRGNLFACAGVSRRISVYEHAAVLAPGSPAQQLPAAELMARSKISSLSWDPGSEHRVAASDYDGAMSLWDVEGLALVHEFEAHVRRVWAVHYCAAAQGLLATGSDDGLVKLWSTSLATMVGQIDVGVNVCCVRWRPGSSHHVALGCSDHHAYLYDTRHVARPLETLSGHSKPVSYVRWLDSGSLITASTDSTLRRWGMLGADPGPGPSSYTGHTNEKNFVGLCVEDGLIASGSETNEVYVYGTRLPRPLACQAIQTPMPAPAPAPGGMRPAPPQPFVSAVAWRPGAEHLLAANSAGAIQLMRVVGSD
ncbi:PCOP1 [Auxenochlorella protothecoides x Auxenochlorella symbiontica]